MGQKVQVDFEARDAVLEAAWKRAQRNAQQLEQDLRKLGVPIEQNKKGLGDFVGKLVTVQSAVNLVTSGIRGWVSANQELKRQADEIALKYDEIGRKFQIQAGLKGLEAESAKKSITKIAVEQSFYPARAMEVATQMVSSGFSAKEASGGSLAEFLRILNAGSAAGKEIDAKQLAEGMTGYLTSQGLEANAANVARMGRGGQRLMNPTNFQIPDFVELAKQGSVLARIATPEEQVAAMSVSRDLGRPGADSATAFRGMGSALMGARVNKRKVAALKEMGLKPEDVDFVGEGFQDVLGRLDKGLESVPAEKRMGALKQLIGEEYSAFALDLIQGRGKIGERVGMMSDDAGFLRDVATATSGPAAGARRLAAEAELFKLGYSEGDANVGQAIESEFLSRGYGPYRAGLRRKEYEVARGLGFSSETSLKWTVGNVTRPEELQGVKARVAAAEAAQGGSSLVYNGRTITDEKEIAKIMQELTGALQENTAATKQNNQATGENTKRQNGGRARDAQPPAPAAANQLDDRR